MEKNNHSRNEESSRRFGQVLDREVPHNLDAEEGLLASCVMDGGLEVITTCIDAHLIPEAFYKPAHQLIYTALIDLFNEGSVVDEIILADKLQGKALLDEVGGYPAITQLTSRIDTTAHARFWLEIVREKYLLRRLIQVSNSIIDKCHHSEESLDHLIEQVEQEIFQVSQDRVTDSAQPIKESIDSAVNLVNQLLLRKGELSGTTSGFVDLDRMTFGWHAQEMVILAARPSMGKTSLAMNFAEAAALPHKNDVKPVPVLVFSLEMSSEQLAMRMLCCRARVNMIRLKEGFMSKEHSKALAVAAKELKEAPLWIDDSGHLTILELRAKARRIAAKDKIGMVIIDYLQLVSGTNNIVPREQQIAEISRGLKAMAKELNVPVIVLSQLNRESEKEKRQPRLSDLRESGSIEQDADVVLLLSKRMDSAENVDQPQASKSRDLIIAKQRNGPVGSVPLTFVPEYTRFENYTETNL